MACPRMVWCNTFNSYEFSSVQFGISIYQCITPHHITLYHITSSQDISVTRGQGKNCACVLNQTQCKTVTVVPSMYTCVHPLHRQLFDTRSNNAYLNAHEYKYLPILYLFFLYILHKLLHSIVYIT